MKLITKAQTEELLANGRRQRAARDKDEDAIEFKPVVKLFTRTRSAPGSSPNSNPTAV